MEENLIRACVHASAPPDTTQCSFQLHPQPTPHASPLSDPTNLGHLLLLSKVVKMESWATKAVLFFMRI